MPGTPPTPIQNCLDRIRDGDPSAKALLLQLSCQRLRIMVRKMLNVYPSVRRWEESDDVLQNVLLRLHRSLEQLPLESTKDFLAIAAVNIRREIIDLYRHYYGPEGIGAKHATPGANDVNMSAMMNAPCPKVEDPMKKAIWTELHEHVERLDQEEREVVDLHWYHGMSQEEVAGFLGISIRTVGRRWQSARIRLAESLDLEIPL